MDIVLTEEDVARFWSYVDRRGPDECWLWTAYGTRFGYGQMWVNSARSKVGAHRISYVLGKGIQPGRLHVLHNCPSGDTPACVNPNHLWLGTQADNNRDRCAKGRANPPTGTHNGRSKLKPEDVPIIRLKKAEGRTFRSLGAEYGVSYCTIWHIITGKNWGHVK